MFVSSKLSVITPNHSSSKEILYQEPNFPSTRLCTKDRSKFYTTYSSLPELPACTPGLNPKFAEASSLRAFRSPRLWRYAAGALGLFGSPLEPPGGPWRPLEASGGPWRQIHRTAWKRLKNPHMHGVTSTDPNIYYGLLLQYIQ